MEKILVTGANRYIGGCIYNEFSKNKRLLVDKLQGRLNEIKPNSLKYDIVIHCAGALRNRKGQHKNTNVNGTSNLIQGLEKTTKIIYISSKSIYGTQLVGSYSEVRHPHPNDEYGISKYEGEKIVKTVAYNI